MKGHRFIAVSALSLFLTYSTALANELPMITVPTGSVENCVRTLTDDIKSLSPQTKKTIEDFCKQKISEELGGDNCDILDKAPVSMYHKNRIYG